MKLGPQGCGKRGKRPEIAFFAAVFFANIGSLTLKFNLFGAGRIRTQKLVLIHEIWPNLDPRKYSQFQGEVGKVAVRFARKIMYSFLKLGVLARVQIWTGFRDKDNFLRSDFLFEKLNQPGGRNTLAGLSPSFYS